MFSLIRWPSVSLALMAVEHKIRFGILFFNIISAIILASFLPSLLRPLLKSSIPISAWAWRHSINFLVIEILHLKSIFLLLKKYIKFL